MQHPQPGDSEDSMTLVHRDGGWYLGRTCLEAGDLLEVRGACVVPEGARNDWFPGVVGANGHSVQLNNSVDFTAEGHAEPNWVLEFEEIRDSGVQLRRV